MIEQLKLNGFQIQKLDTMYNEPCFILDAYGNRIITSNDKIHSEQSNIKF